MIHRRITFLLLAFTTVREASAQRRGEIAETASRGSDSALIDVVQRRPMAARGVWRDFLKSAGGTTDSASAAAFAAAARIAGAIVVVWRDSFLLHQGARFQALSLVDQIADVAADSLWDAAVPLVSGARGMDALPLFRESLRQFTSLSDTSGIAAALVGEGIVFKNVQEYDSAVAYFMRARDAAERVGDLRMLANALGDLGQTKWRQGDLRAARDWISQAGEINVRMGDKRNLLINKNDVGLLAWSGGDLATAQESFDSGLALARDHHDSSAISLFLSNLGGMTAERGDYAGAIQLLQQAVEIYRVEANSLEVAVTLLTVGQVQNRRGNFPSAVQILKESAGILERLGPEASAYEVDETTVRTELAQTLAKMGDLQGARAELRRAEALTARYPGAKARASLTDLAIARGDLALEFNDPAEAERQYVRARRLARGEGAAQKRSRAAVGLATVFVRRENYARAQQLLQNLLKDPAADAHNAAMIRLELGQAAVRGGDTLTARRAFREALDTLHAMGATSDEAEALGGLGVVAARTGHVMDAESLFLAGLARLNAGTGSTVGWQLHADLGASMRRRGALADAARELRASIEQIERISVGLRLEEQRSAFQADKWGAYTELALVERARGMTEAAFAVSERLRARQMLDLLARGQVAPSQSSGTLAIREQDLRRQMAELSSQLDTVSNLRDTRGGEAASPATAQTRAALVRAQDDYQRLLLEVREANPAYAALVRGETIGARDVSQVLHADEALLEYLVGDSTTILFVVTHDTVASLDLHLPHSALAAQVDFARAQLLNPRNRTLPARDWRPSARRLYERLIAPVESARLLTGKQRLIVVPHAELHYLPFAALLRPGPPEQPLVQRYIVEYVPSASVWLRLRDRTRRTAGVGALALAPRPNALPGSLAEIEAVRRAFRERAAALVGAAATESAFRTLAPQRDVVHLATHGVLNKHNPLFSFVQLEPGAGDDGRLEVHEVFGLNLQARLLVLSACQTGVGAGTTADVPAGDDWVGFVNAFLLAGAGNVLGTLWPVEDVSTARLMTHFYQQLGAGRSEAEALALAQRAALREPASSHPFYWAGFTLVRGN